MKTVITYGTFDLFHIGHVRLLKRLSNLGDKLIVGVSTDEFNLKKGKKSFSSYEERKEIVESCKYVDLVIPENNWEQKVKDIDFYGVDVFAIGDDWTGKFDDLKKICDVVYLSRTEDVSTTQIKRSLSKFGDNELDSIESNVYQILDIIRTLSKR